MTKERFKEIKKEAIEEVINKTFPNISREDRIKVFLWGVNELFIMGEREDFLKKIGEIKRDKMENMK